MTALADLPRIGLPELETLAARLRRTDRKYLLTADDAREVLSLLPSGTRVLDVDGDTSFRYRSTYFDTPALDAYHLAAHSRPHRFKVRIREYEDSGATWLEVKTRERGQTVKERMLLDRCDPSTIEQEHHGFITSCLERGRVRDVRPAGLRPTLATRYRRRTLLAPDGASRVTIDDGLAWLTNDGPVPARDVVIIETKSPGTAGVVDHHLWRHGHRPVRISKYATGLALVHRELPANRWHRPLVRHFL